MNRYCRLPALRILLAAVPAFALTAFVDMAFAHTWKINGQKVEGDFVKESHVAEGRKKVDVVVLAVGSELRPYPVVALSGADKKYEREQVALQRRTVHEIDERTWTDVHDKKVQGRLMDMEKANVVLLIKNETVRLPFDKFTSSDQDYVRQELTARGEGEKVPKKIVAAAPRQIAQSTPGQPNTTKPTKPKNTKRPAPPNPTPPDTASQIAAPASDAPKSTQLPPAAAVTTTQQSVVVASAAQPQTFAAVTPPSGVNREHPKEAVPATLTVPESRCADKSRSSARGTHSAHAMPCKYRVCSRCGFRLPVTCKPGDVCPHCGTYFSYEQEDESRITAPATLRSLGAPAGFVSLLGVVAVTIFRARWYLLRG